MAENSLEIKNATGEMRRLYGRTAFDLASARAAMAHLKRDTETFEFWRAVAIQIKQEGDDE